MQIDDFIVLPMGTAVDTPMKVIEKHLKYVSPEDMHVVASQIFSYTCIECCNIAKVLGSLSYYNYNVSSSLCTSIVNQMLWSMQLEIPDSPSEVVKRNQSKPKKVRGRLFSLNKRESYVTMLVEESMERISEEDDRRAMAAATVRRNSLESQSVGEEKAGRTLSPVTSTGGLATLQEEEGQKDQERRQEEGQQEEGQQEEGRQEEGTDAPQVLKASNVSVSILVSTIISTVHVMWYYCVSGYFQMLYISRKGSSFLFHGFLISRMAAVDHIFLVIDRSLSPIFGLV